MKSLLGQHWIRTHPDGRDYAHVEAMQYKSVKLFEWHWNNRDACRDLLAVLPKDSYILARDHPLSEQKEEMWRDPVGTGTRHANEWADKVQSGRYFMPTDRSFFLGINEPDATNGDRNAIDLYYEAFLVRLKRHGLRGGAFSFSTGHPRTVDGTEGTQADYSAFERTHRAIVDGNGIGVLHIYGTASTPCVPGHYDRLKACPWQDVEWVVGEFAPDEHVIGGGPHDGYLISMKDNPSALCPWLDTAIMGINDPRIHSYQGYTYDYSHPWDSFDTRVVRDALERYDWQHMKQRPTQPDTPPITIHLPQIDNGPTVPQPASALGYVTALAGLNLRPSPDTNNDALALIPYGEQIRITAVADQRGWVRARYDGREGWVSSEYISLQSPAPVETEPAPVPATQGIINPLTALAFMQVESGNRAFEGGYLVIRFEVHRFKANLKNDALFDLHFKFTPGNYSEQYWRRDTGSPWLHAHGNQHERHELLRFAERLNQKAAYLSIGMGMAQIMGENHARVGYATPQAMFKAFSHPEYGVNAQVMGFVNYVLSDLKLLEALRRRDWMTAVQKYNGIGQEHIYVPRLERALQDIQREIGA